jgi:large subunit ribosomal protein L41
MLTSFGTWFINSGIFCDGFGDVQQISLESNNLVGVIPGEISSYSSLRVFDLYGNILRGAIPTKFNSLENLEVLSLSANTFLTGSIPARIPNRARIISVTSNLLTGSISHYVGKELVELLVSNNKFDGSLPSDMSAMTKLKTFSVSNNDFTGTIPETIVDCKSLDSRKFF